MIKNPPANARDAGDIGSVPGLRRSPEEGDGNPLHCSCLVNAMDRGAWQATIHGVTKESNTTVTKHTHTHTHLALANSRVTSNIA